MTVNLYAPNRAFRHSCHLLLYLTCWCLPHTYLFAQSNQLLWQLGRADNAATEFANYRTANPEAFTVPTDWATRTNWTVLSKGLKGDLNPAMTISFNLASVPANGVLFSVKILHSDRSAPEMAVFSNGTMAGLIQLWGTGNINVPDRWRKTYQLYIPKELLQAGTNVLRLEASRSIYASATIDPFLYWEWDYLNLAALGAPAKEPIHGKLTYMGTSVKLNSDNFSINDNVLATAPVKLKWMGVAYSNNTIRADYWSDISSTTTQNRRLEYLQLLRDLNMTVIADHLNSNQATLDASGNLSTADQTRLTNFFNAYGNLFQYYEIDNEPGLFNRSKAVNLAIGRYVNQIKPAHVKTTAPGWAYWPTNGSPSGWERDPAHRRDVENLAQATNGHSYGQSYADAQGGSFAENLETYGGVSDGWSKEYVNTEMGTDNGHQDFGFAGASQPNAAIFDRITRAHVAVVDRFMHHATTFGSFSMFNRPTDWTNPNLLEAYPGINGQDTRLKTWRRLALAYATHGAPLKYEHLNRAAIAGRKVYFRGVNTATLKPLPGSGATSSKILLNFVNFEGTAQTMNVRVTLPGCGAVTGERISGADSYSTAFSTVSLNATPTVDLTVALGPRESVQYILNQPSGTCAATFPTGNDRIFIEAEGGQVTAPMQILTDVQASTARYITVAPGNNSGGGPPTTGIASHTFATAEAGAYQIWGRVIAPAGADDSFWVKVDNGAWINWNGAGVSGGTFATSWRWSKVVSEANGGNVATFNLPAGAHTLQIAYREDGARLDQLIITNNPTYSPSGDLQLPSTPTNVTASGITANSTTLTWTASTDNTAVTGYDVYQGEVLAGSVGAGTTSLALTGLSQGSPYAYTVRARDAANNSSLASNSATVQTQVMPRADLTITNLSLSPNAPTVNQRVSLRVTVRNQGTAPTPAGTVIGVNFKANGTQVNFADRFNEVIAPGASVTIVANGSSTGATTWTPATAGAYALEATVDDVGRISEESETNNVLSQTVTVGTAVPEVVTVTAPADKATFEVGGAIPFTANASSSGVSRVEFYVNGAKIGEDLTSPYSLNWTPSTPGTYALTARSTYTAGTQLSSAVVVFVNPQRPDLIVTDISWSPANPAVNTAVRFTAVVRNQGLVATPAGTVVGVSFFIKRNGANTSQTWSDTFQSAIAPGASVTLTANGSANGTGTYTPPAARADTVEAFVDDINRIAERFDDNNRRTEIMTVGSGGRVGASPEPGVADLGVVLYPVPARDMVRIRAIDPIESVQLTSLLGAELPITYTYQHEREVAVRLGTQPGGLYLVIVRTGGKAVTKRLLIQP